VLKPPNRAQERPRRRLWRPKTKKIHQIPNTTPRVGVVRRTRGGRWRGKGRQAPQEYNIRQSILNASLPNVNVRVRRIEYADARPPHLHLEFIRLGCSECLLWFSPGLRQDFAKTLPEFGDGICRWEGLRIVRWRDKIDPRRVQNRAQIAQGTPKSSPRASKTTNFKFFRTFLKKSGKF